MKGKLLYFSKERHATWLELFFDLVFVALIGKVTHLLNHSHHGHLEVDYLIKFPLLFIPVWWIWSSHTIYNNIYDEDSREQRVITLIIMLLMIILSVFLSTNFERVYLGFITIFTLIRGLIGGLYLSKVSKGHIDCLHYSKKRGKIHLITALAGLASIFFPPPIRYFVVYISILLEIILNFRLEQSEHHVEVHIEHLVERTGLLTIILLGETVIGIVGSMEGIVWNLSTVISFLCGFLMIGSYWWINFDSFDFLERSGKLTKPYMVMIPHAVLCMGLAILASVIRYSISQDLELSMFRWLMGGGMLLFYIGKQIPYAIAYREIRKNQLINTAVTLILVGMSLFLGDYHQIMAGILSALLVYISLNYRYVLKEELL